MTSRKFYFGASYFLSFLGQVTPPPPPPRGMELRGGGGGSPYYCPWRCTIAMGGDFKRCRGLIPCNCPNPHAHTTVHSTGDQKPVVVLTLGLGKGGWFEDGQPNACLCTFMQATHLHRIALAFLLVVVVLPSYINYHRPIITT